MLVMVFIIMNRTQEIFLLPWALKTIRRGEKFSLGPCWNILTPGLILLSWWHLCRLPLTLFFQCAFLPTVENGENGKKKNTVLPSRGHHSIVLVLGLLICRSPLCPFRNFLKGWQPRWFFGLSFWGFLPVHHFFLNFLPQRLDKRSAQLLPTVRSCYPFASIRPAERGGWGGAGADLHS